jgi:hypothetical protein
VKAEWLPLPTFGNFCFEERLVRVCCLFAS